MFTTHIVNSSINRSDIELAIRVEQSLNWHRRSSFLDVMATSRRGAIERRITLRAEPNLLQTIPSRGRGAFGRCYGR